MEIQIELLLIITLILMFLIWKIWFKLTNKLNNRRYKPENDKSKQGEERRIAELEARERRAEEEPNNVPGPDELDKQGSIPTTATYTVGKTSNSNRKVSRKFRNPFRRRGR